MKKFYPCTLGKLCLALLFTLLFTQFAKAQIRTYDTTFDGWNAIVTEDLSLHGNDSAAGIIFFPGIGQQTKNINDLKVNGPHYLIENGMWDGSVTLGNGVHHPFIISLQPPTSGYPAMVVKPKIDEILARYRIKRNSLYFTGLSLGSWQANEFITYEASPGDHTYGRMVKAMVNLEGVEPADDAGIYSSLAYPGKMGDWAANCGGRELWVEGSNDWRDMEAGADNMNGAVPGSATYFMVNYGGGAHCCWNTEYNPSVTWSTAANKNIVKIDGPQVPMNVWQWLLRQGDTSMPGGAATAVAPPPPPPAPPAPAAPNVSAGGDPTITLPTTGTTLSGTAAGSNGAKITAISWKQTAGPVTAKIASPGSLTTGISGLTVAGMYTFLMTATDQNGKQSAASVNVIVNPAPQATPPATPPSTPPASKPATTAPATPTPPPTASAGNGQTITLPVTTVTLAGTASGANGAKIKTIAWKESSGPVAAKIVSPSSLTTVVSGLTLSGTYQFRLTVSDQNGRQSASVVNVVVNPAVKTAPPTVNAGIGQTITLPTTSVTVHGTATGNDGATIKEVSWMQASGPVTASLSAPTSLTTAISGLTNTGSYVFKLTATDNKGASADGTVTVTVGAAKAAAPAVAPTVSAGISPMITLPTTTTTLKGSATGGNGALITEVLWQESKGPVEARIASPGSLETAISGLTVSGDYIFRLTVTDQNGRQAAAVVTVAVYPAGAKLPPPIVNAGKGLVVEMPTSSLTIRGTAVGVDGATIKAVNWVQESGPEKASLSAPSSLTTKVSGMTQAGRYIFKLTATDSYGISANASMTVTVEPGNNKVGANDAPTVNAGADQTITLPTNSVTLKGSAASHDGGIVNSYFWVMVSGPSWVKFSNEWEPATSVTGMVAGTYTFELEASDNLGGTSNASMTVVVKPKPADGNGETSDVDGNIGAADSINHIGHMVMFPNPVQNLLNIHLDNAATGKIVVAVFDMRGTRVLSQELDKESFSAETSMDVSRLAAGMYVIEVISGPNLRTVDKFIKD